MPSSTPWPTDLGTFTARVLGDLARKNFDLGIRCRRCGRHAVFAAPDVIMLYVARRIPMALPLDMSPFRCRCGSRDVELIPVQQRFRPDPLPQPTPQPIYIKEPGQPRTAGKQGRG